MRYLPYLASRILGTPLMIHQPKLDVILSVIGNRININQLNIDTITNASLNKNNISKQINIQTDGLYVIPIKGTLVKNTNGLETESGLTSYANIKNQLSIALQDASIKGILLDIDSPGGEVAGVFDIARSVQSVAQIKPVWAIANDGAFSAAYAIASGANKIYVTETGGVGSIGVIALHIDQSVKDANDGYKYTAIIAGAHKNDFSPHEPLSDASRSELQSEVDRLYDIFVTHVASARKMSIEDIKNTEARLYFGENAVNIGLADEVSNIDNVISNFLEVIYKKETPKMSIVKHKKEEIKMNMEAENDSIKTTDESISKSIDIESEIADVKAKVKASAHAIAELCMLAGCPEKTADYLASDMTEDEIRKDLLKFKSSKQSAEISTSIGVEVEKNPLVEAIKKNKK